MTSRRDLLAYLGVGSTSALAGCAGFLSGDGTDDGATPEAADTATDTPTATPSGTTGPSHYERAREMLPDPGEWIDVDPPAYDFDYERRTITDPPDDLERVVGEGRPDRQGDRLRLTTRGLDPAELAARLRIAWRVTAGEVTVEERVGDGRCRFVGGRGLTAWHVVGVHDPSGAVLAVRATAESDLRALAAEPWSL